MSVDKQGSRNRLLDSSSPKKNISPTFITKRCLYFTSPVFLKINKEVCLQERKFGREAYKVSGPGAFSRKSRKLFGPGKCFVLVVFAFKIKVSIILKIIQ